MTGKSGKLTLDGGVVLEYTLTAPRTHGTGKDLIAEAQWNGKTVKGEPRLTQRAAEASLKRMVIKLIEVERQAVEDRRKLEDWNAGKPRQFGHLS